MKSKRLRGPLWAAFLLPVVLLGLLLGGEPAGSVWAAEGIKAGQKFELLYVHASGQEVFAEATLSADGSLLLVFPSADGKRVARAAYKVTRLDTVPDPGPGPKPPPPPPPIKRVTDIYVVWETGQATPAHAAIRNNQAWKDEATKLKIRWGQMDKDTIASIPKFKAVSEAAAGKIPCVVKVDEEGKATTEPLPKTPDEMTALVRKAGQKP